MSDVKLLVEKLGVTDYLDYNIAFTSFCITGGDTDAWYEDNGLWLQLYAAYTKAEMAKRGWVLRWASYGSVSFSMYRPKAGRVFRTEWQQFAPTDPLSEARAIIKACLEALELEGGE